MLTFMVLSVVFMLFCILGMHLLEVPQPTNTWNMLRHALGMVCLQIAGAIILGATLFSTFGGWALVHNCP